MADNVIKVSVTSTKSQRVSVSSSQVATNITASPDTGRFWSQTSKNWAVSENIVDGEDYSSKYYANKSKESANTAKSYLETTQETYSNFVTSANGYISELTDLKDAGAVEINEAVANGKDEINSAKTTILNDIEFVADGEKKEIEDLIDNGKEELKESIGDVKVLTTLKIGQIGIAPLGIDETLNLERYLNGQIILQDQFNGFTKYLKRRIELYPSLACIEDEWQTEVTKSAFSQCGKFVIDDNAGTIRLPKVVNIQGLTDLSKLGEIVEAGLPNIEGRVGVQIRSGAQNTVNSGALYFTENNKYSYSNYGSGGSLEGTVNFNASRSNPIYGNSNTVQQEQIQYPYFIQVATGAETEDNIINEIELNNPFSLLDYKYSEYELNNLSWLRSNGQYNSKAVYPAVYDLLLKIYNGTETKAGVSVKLSTETFTDYDFVLNTAEETFRLPIKVKLASGKAVVGNGMTLGVTNGSQNAGLNGSQSSSAWDVFNPNCYGLDVSSTGPSAGHISGNIGITTDPTKSGIETSDSDLYLYFYVGETVQNANLINAGRIEEKLVDKVDINSKVIDGQWVSKPVTLSTATAVGSYTIDLSDYLPNDNCVYEVCFTMRSYSQKFVGVYLSTDLFKESGNTGLVGVVAGDSFHNINTFIKPVGAGRYAKLQITVNALYADSALMVNGYRRVGTNQ